MKILLFLLFPLFLACQCPVSDCTQTYYINDFDPDLTEANAASGDKCFINNGQQFGIPMWGLEMKDWNHLTIYAVKPGQLYLTEPITIGRGQNIYITGVSLLQYPTFKDGGTVYINNHLNINTLIEVQGENYIYMSDSATLNVENYAPFIPGDTIKKTERHYSLVLKCGTSGTKKISQPDRSIYFELFGMKGYILNGRKYLIIK